MIVFTFDTTHHALWAEEVAGEEGLPVEVIPAPAEARARCDIALETYPEAGIRLHELLDSLGISHRMLDYPADSS